MSQATALISKLNHTHTHSSSIQEEAFSPFPPDAKNKQGTRLTHHDFFDPEKLLQQYRSFMEDESISKVEEDVELHPLLPGKNPLPFMPPINKQISSITYQDVNAPSTFRSASKTRRIIGPSAQRLPILSKSHYTPTPQDQRTAVAIHNLGDFYPHVTISGPAKSSSRAPRSLATSPRPPSLRGELRTSPEVAGIPPSGQRGVTPATLGDAVEDHFVYFLYDGTNLKDEALNVGLLNVGEHIHKLIPTKQSFLNSVMNKYLTVREKIRLSKPTREIL